MDGPGLLQHHEVLHRGLSRGHPLKERVVDRRYDPLFKLARRIAGRRRP